MTTFRILSIDGGGIRGLLPAKFLVALERAAGRPIHTMFDFVAGSSTGAICGAALLRPRPLSAGDLLDFYLSDGPRIFNRRASRTALSVFAGPLYEEETIEAILRDVFGDVWLSEVLRHFLVPSYELTNRKAEFFESWKAQARHLRPNEYPGMFDYRLRDVVRAASAAPTYFRPAQIASRAGVTGTYIDSAIVANNPSMCALASCRKIAPEATRVVLVSLGTGQRTQPITYQESSTWGLLNWARPALDCMMDGAADAVTYQVSEALGGDVQQYRFTFASDGVMANGPIDDASPLNIRKLLLAADAEMEAQASLIEHLPAVLLEAERV